MPKTGREKPALKLRQNSTVLNRALNVEWVAPSQLVPNPRNARTHSGKQIRKLSRCIGEIGFINPILVDDSYMVLAGHGRLAAAKLEGMETIPILRVGHLTEAQKRLHVIADNKIAEEAGWDRELLSLELLELNDLLPAEGLDLSITGFEPAEIDLLSADMTTGVLTADDELPPIPTVASTKVGDLWQLGKHRLLCGDSREGSHLTRLMNGVSAAAIFCDPPYNLKIRSIVGRGRIKHAEFACASGEMSNPQFTAFLTTTLANAIRVSAPGAVHFVCIDWRHIGVLLSVGEELYSTVLNVVVWNKTNAGQGSFYRSQHELIGVFRVGDDPHRNNIELGKFGRNRSNVWTYPGVNTFGRGRMEALASHPTVKPVALVADALLDCTARGDPVLDHFAGSGTILLAAEKVGRAAYALEYDPRYVDVAVKRWQTATRLEATLAEDGRTFEEVSATRAKTAIGTCRDA